MTLHKSCSKSDRRSWPSHWALRWSIIAASCARRVQCIKRLWLYSRSRELSSPGSITVYTSEPSGSSWLGSTKTSMASVLLKKPGCGGAASSSVGRIEHKCWPSLRLQTERSTKSRGSKNRSKRDSAPLLTSPHLTCSTCSKHMAQLEIQPGTPPPSHTTSIVWTSPSSVPQLRNSDRSPSATRQGGAGTSVAVPQSRPSVGRRTRTLPS
mmetsp:Transcript_44649/g.104281  ORF Transcript_44649/g.104281 Transcript_44649/m.104281 type:complete len:210 (-) Transcript_44649:329-958(-)